MPMQDGDTTMTTSDDDEAKIEAALWRLVKEYIMKAGLTAGEVQAFFEGSSSSEENSLDATDEESGGMLKILEDMKPNSKILNKSSDIFKKLDVSSYRDLATITENQRGGQVRSSGLNDGSDGVFEGDIKKLLTYLKSLPQGGGFGSFGNNKFTTVVEGSDEKNKNANSYLNDFLNKNGINAITQTGENELIKITINQTYSGMHYYFQNAWEAYVVGDCGLYALIRAMLKAMLKAEYSIGDDVVFDEKIVSQLRDVAAVMYGDDRLLAKNGKRFMPNGALQQLAKLFGFSLTIIDHGLNDILEEIKKMEEGGKVSSSIKQAQLSEWLYSSETGANQNITNEIKEKLGVSFSYFDVVEAIKTYSNSSWQSDYIADEKNQEEGRRGGDDDVDMTTDNNADDSTTVAEFGGNVVASALKAIAAGTKAALMPQVVLDYDEKMGNDYDEKSEESSTSSSGTVSIDGVTIPTVENFNIDFSTLNTSLEIEQLAEHVKDNPCYNYLKEKNCGNLLILLKELELGASPYTSNEINQLFTEDVTNNEQIVENNIDANTFTDAKTKQTTITSSENFNVIVIDSDDISTGIFSRQDEKGNVSWFITTRQLNVMQYMAKLGLRKDYFAYLAKHEWIEKVLKEQKGMPPQQAHDLTMTILGKEAKKWEQLFLLFNALYTAQQAGISNLTTSAILFEELLELGANPQSLHDLNIHAEIKEAAINAYVNPDGAELLIDINDNTLTTLEAKDKNWWKDKRVVIRGNTVMENEVERWKDLLEQGFVQFVLGEEAGLALMDPKKKDIRIAPTAYLPLSNTIVLPPGKAVTSELYNQAVDFYKDKLTSTNAASYISAWINDKYHKGEDVLEDQNITQENLSELDEVHVKQFVILGEKKYAIDYTQQNIKSVEYSTDSNVLKATLTEADGDLSVVKIVSCESFEDDAVSTDVLMTQPPIIVSLDDVSTAAQVVAKANYAVNKLKDIAGVIFPWAKNEARKSGSTVAKVLESDQAAALAAAA